ncbi:Crp/Fnr family transcriptional regulator [Neoroseomonas soli]|uniref:Cyclic nucleotide-binding domain-containing protein n=1 Tax=Neoroseomonas soli TaxID=1081025 RepID=A0A9X9X1F5_9PROT|nr:cyclic nucleotide-binding domain-containing protein [Neoroseomonas soli]MBR0673234.1 cyclic nucleotide-binding domain-containing protein [Neoroseomonas soli]
MSATNIADVDMCQTVSSLGTVQSYAAGDTIFREGDPARYMYVVLNGMVEIASRGRTIETLMKGDALGIVSLIDGRTRSTNAIATIDCELAVLDERTFRHAVEEVPHFVWFVMDELARRLRATNAAL